MTLEKAKEKLAKFGPVQGMRCFGIPVEEFDKEDLLCILNVLEKDKLRSVQMDKNLADIRAACDKARGLL